MARTHVILALDSGALIQAQKDRRVAEIIRTWVREGASVFVPAVVLAEVIRGRAADATVNRLLKVIGDVPEIDEAVARAAGTKLGAGKGDAIDALVVATAERNGATDIVTTGARDIRRLAGAGMNVIAL